MNVSLPRRPNVCDAQHAATLCAHGLWLRRGALWVRVSIDFGPI
jgi:hypothetical protein